MKKKPEIQNSGHWVLGFLILIFIAFSCNNSSQPSAANGEGMITYKISYLENNPYKKIKILPRETILFFKDNKASFITSGFGIIQVVNLLDNDKKRFTSLLINSIGENYAFIETQEDVKQMENNPEYNIERTNEKKMIAGLECNKAIVNNLTNNTKFDIYYYDKIKVYLGNSPYKDFNYLLMEYQDTRYGLPMLVEATKVDFSPVDTFVLNVHGEFNWVDRETFLNIIKKLQVSL